MVKNSLPSSSVALSTTVPWPSGVRALSPRGVVSAPASGSALAEADVVPVSAVPVLSAVEVSGLFADWLPPLDCWGVSEGADVVGAGGVVTTGVGVGVESGASDSCPASSLGGW